MNSLIQLASDDFEGPKIKKKKKLHLLIHSNTNISIHKSELEENKENIEVQLSITTIIQCNKSQFK